jgi:general secretion pathway protein G
MLERVNSRRFPRLRVRGANSAPSSFVIDHLISGSRDHEIRQRRDRGFTMIELLIVLSLLMILATMGMTQYRSSQVYAKEAVLKTDLFRMREAIDQYYGDKGQYPSSLDALVSDGYMRKMPEDPFTKSASSWQAVPAEPDPNNPASEPGVYDVKSGSDATALDGTRYADW